MFYENKPDAFIIYNETVPLQYPLHLHQYIEIVRLVEGSLEMQIGSQKYLMQPGDVTVSFPNVVHDYHTLSQPGETQITIINCYADILPLHKKILSKQQPSTPLIPASLVHEDVIYAEKRLFEMNPRENNGALITSLCSLMLCRLCPQLHLEDVQTQPNDITSAVISYIAEHYLEDISLTSIASHFGIGKYALSRMFSNVLNCNFITYINSLRISHSHALLVNTDMNITRVAIECGFNNQQTFNRIFMQFEGCTPKEYRQTHTEVKVNSSFL